MRQNGLIGLVFLVMVNKDGKYHTAATYFCLSRKVFMVYLLSDVVLDHLLCG